MEKNVASSQWTVIFSRKAEKQKSKLPPAIADQLYTLRKELEAIGPAVPGWPRAFCH